MKPEMAATRGESGELMEKLKEAARRAASGIRDREIMRQACEQMDRLREENKAKFGVQDVGVQIIREMRDAR